MISSKFTWKLLRHLAFTNDRCISILSPLGSRSVATKALKDSQIEVEFDRDDQHYRIKLNNVSLKTPKRELLKVRDKSLAIAIANEWRANVSRKKLNLANMHLTTLAYTAIDNPFEETNESLIAASLEYLKFDTTRFRDVDNKELLDRQSRHWDPLVGWFEHNYDCHLPIDYGDLTNTSDVPSATIDSLTRYLESHGRWSLIGINFLTRNLKSFVLTTALTERLLSATRAVELARLETLFQVDKWSKVEWEHDIDEQCTNARVAAGTLFYHLSK